MKNSILEYLEERLITDTGFKKFGQNSLIFESDIDKILVYINSSNLIIIHDGININHGIEMIQIIDSEEDTFDEIYLQPILHKF